MYLTRFEINRARRDTRRILSSLQTMHAAVRASFPSSDTSEQRALWRVDHTDRALWLYIASPTQPDLTHLAEQIGWPSRNTWQTKDYTPLLDGLAARQRWSFRLTANPTRSGKTSPESRTTQRFGHVTVEQQRQWLIDRTERLGITIGETVAGDTDLIVRDRTVHRFDRQGSTITLNTATYDGTLVVTDSEALRSALVRGIGPAKAYGCGLMTLVAT